MMAEEPCTKCECSAGLQESSSEADLPPIPSTDKEAGPQTQPQLLPRSISTPGHQVASHAKTSADT